MMLVPVQAIGLTLLHPPPLGRLLHQHGQILFLQSVIRIHRIEFRQLEYLYDCSDSFELLSPWQSNCKVIRCLDNTHLVIIPKISSPNLPMIFGTLIQKHLCARETQCLSQPWATASSCLHPLNWRRKVPYATPFWKSKTAHNFVHPSVALFFLLFEAF